MTDYGFIGDSSLFIIGNQWVTVCDTGYRIVDLPSNGTCMEIHANNHILIGTYDGIYQYTRSGKLVAQHLEKRTIHDLFTDSDNALWVGTSEEGVYYARSLKHLSFPSLLPRRKAPLDIIVEKDWFALVGENKTLDLYSRDARPTGHFSDVLYYQNRYSSGDKKLSDYLGYANYYKERQDYMFFGLKHDRDSLHIFAMDKSIFCFTKGSSSSIKNTMLPTINGHYLLNDSVILLPTNRGIYELINFNYIRPFAMTHAFHDWSFKQIIAFRDGFVMSNPTRGLLFVNNHQHILVNTQTGLLSNEIIALETDNDSLIWVASTEGVTAITVSSNNKPSVYHHTYESGVNDTKINCFTRHNDSIWVGTRLGVCVFPESAVFDEQILNPDHFKVDSVYVDEKKIKIINDTVYAEYGKLLTVHFNQINLSASGSINYSYNFSSAPDIWLETTGNSLQHVCQNSGYQTLTIHSGHPAFTNCGEIKLVIFTPPPYWQKWWFFTLILLLIAGIIFLFVRIFVRIQQNKRTRDVEKLRLEMKALVSQMNPHFTFNSINSIQAYIINNDRKDAVSYLSEFALLIRKTLEYSHKEFIFVAEEIEFLQLYTGLEKRRFDFEFDVNFSFNKPITESSFKLPPLLLQPILENAILHGISKKKSGPRSIYLKFTEHTDSLIVEIEDNGPGINFEAVTNHGRESFGIKILEQRLKIFNDVHYQPTDFEIQKLTDNLGTRVRIILRRNG